MTLPAHADGPDHARHADTLSRPRLEVELDAIRDHAVTLVAAPAGFGKTTLLSDWARRQTAALAWVALDAESGGAPHVWAAVARALDAAVPGSVGSVVTPDGAIAPGALPHIGALLARDLMRVSAPLALVIDDVHHARDDLALQQLAQLIDRAPPNLCVVLISRTDPPLPLARWRAQGRLLEVRADVLRFTAAETAELLHRRLGRDLDGEAVAVIAERTEGWAAGIHLASLMLRGQADQGAALDGLRGSHRFLIDYLTEEVLSRQPPAVQRFLGETAWLDRLCGPLCDAVTERTDGQVQLEALESANLFLVPLDTERRWYRYSYLFVECVRAWSRRYLTLDVTQLQRRAASWWLSQGRPREAVVPLLRAGAAPEALELITSLAPELVSRGELITLTGWLDQAPRALVVQQPEVLRTYAWALLFTRRTEDAAAVLGAAGQPLDPSVAEELGALRELIAAVRHSQGFGDLFDRPAFQRIMAQSPLTRGVASYIGLNRAAPSWSAEEPGASGAFAPARQLIQQGQLRAAGRLLAQALAAIDARDPQPIAAPLWMTMAEVCFAQNQLDTAAEHAERALTLAARLGNSHVTLLTQVTLLHIQRAAGRTAAAAELDATISRGRVAPYVFPWVSALVLAEQLRHALISRDMAVASVWELELAALRCAFDDMPAYQRVTIDLALARAAWKLRRADVRPQVAAIERLSAECGWSLRRIDALLLLTRVADSAGDARGAVGALTQALALAAPEDATRLILDGGPELERLLAAVTEPRDEADPLHGFVARLRQVHSADHTPIYPPRVLARGAPRQSPLEEPLSEREGEVLQLLAAGYSNREMAAALVIAEGTLKTHLRNIYSKLAVASRTQAIARARAIGLFDAAE